MMVRNLLELRREIVRAWMRIEEREWQKSREEWKQEAYSLEKEFKDELKRIQKIPAVPPSFGVSTLPKAPFPLGYP